MISYLKGKIIKKGENYMVVDVNNIGYKVFVSEKLLAKAKNEEEINVYTHQYVREDSLDLYGFPSPDELDLFELLISISGIGPKSALAALAIASVGDLKATIAKGEPTLLTKVSGIGKKTAERVVLELKDKVEYLASTDGSGTETVGMIPGNDEIDALMALGYSFAQARESLSKVDKNITESGERVKQALKEIKK